MDKTRLQNIIRPGTAECRIYNIIIPTIVLHVALDCGSQSSLNWPVALDINRRDGNNPSSLEHVSTDSIKCYLTTDYDEYALTWLDWRCSYIQTEFRVDNTLN